MKTYSLCLVLLFAAVANAAVQDRPDNNVNEVHQDFQEDIHLMENGAILNIIEEEELLGNYDDPDDDYYEDYDEDEDWASGDDDEDTNAAVQDRTDNNANDVHHDFQEYVHLMENEADSKIIDLDKEEEELLGNYDDPDDDYYEDYDEDEEDEDWASGDEYHDEDEKWLDDYEEEDDITFDDDKDEELLDDYEDDDDDITFDNENEEWLDDYKEEEDDITFDDDKDDILYKYHAEDYEGIDFFNEIEEVPYQPPQVQIRDHGKPDKENETVTVAELSPSSRNLLVSKLWFATGLASFALLTLIAFIMYFCIRRSKYSTSAKKAQLPFVIQHGSGSSPLQSSIIKPGKYQPVATQENRSNHSIENDNSLLKQQTQLEEKLLP